MNLDTLFHEETGYFAGNINWNPDSGRYADWADGKIRSLQSELGVLKNLIVDSFKPHGRCFPESEKACSNCIAQNKLKSIANKITKGTV